MSNTTSTAIRIFTHTDVPWNSAVEAQATDLAAAHGLDVEIVDVTVDAAEALASGVMGLPAIIAYRDNAEVARRECTSAGRGMSRWFERKVASQVRVPAMTPAMA